ncbi:MAG: (Fe-S)-binding protein [Bacteroidales bacterium]|jgi:Fe-S oxidoreductase|nr:(Fe-S)-binding protein [Bacteroidales bacterium]
MHNIQNEKKVKANMEKLTKQQIDEAVKLLKMPADSKLITHLNACVHCGLCAESCMFYRTMKENSFIPACKVDLVASLYRRYCTLTGRVVPFLTNARELDEETAEKMTDMLFGSCTMCGRCVKHCSIGVDIPYIVHVGRQMLAAMGLVPPTLQSTVDAALETGNNMAIPAEDFTDTLQWLEEELIDEYGSQARIPLNETGKRVLYTLNPREPKFFPLSISAMAKIFFAAKESWTISTNMYDVTNYGLFNGNNDQAKQIAERLHDEVIDMQAQVLVLGECGHGTRANRWEAPNYLHRKYEFDVISVVELINKYIRRGRIRLDKLLNPELVTIHDPCNLVRNGGLTSEIRFAVQHSVNEYVEMNPYGTDNFCCGGGGGLLAMSEYNERRLKAGEIKAEQIRATQAKVVVTPCHNCVDQLTQLNHTYKLGVKIKTIAEIVADALVLETV